MKSSKFTLLILIITLFISCENQKNAEIETPTISNEYETRNNNSTFKITENKALEYANIVFNRNKTRTISEITVDYVVEQSNARSLSSDTIAYIFNKGENEGFAIISSDNRINPLLAFSESGHFDYDKNSIVNQEFILKLGDYINKNANNGPITLPENFLDGCYAMQSNISGSWHQRDPWNSIVNIYHPGCPVGCVAVATAIVMTHCKESLLYHGINFPLARIGAGIDQNSNSRIVGGSGGSSNIVPLPYDSAVNYAAQLLYYIGLDVNMNYGVNGSGAAPSSGLTLLNNKNFPLRHTQLATYNLINVINYIKNGDIIYMRGSTVNGSGGHAWIANGTMFCVDSNNNITDGYIYCHWGWGGTCDGFYNGDVFYTTQYSFQNMQYFAIDKI